MQDFNSKNTVIIDDNDEVHKTQEGNCFHIKPFHFTHENSHDDDELEKLTLKLDKSKDMITPQLVLE